MASGRANDWAQTPSLIANCFSVFFSLFSATNFSPSLQWQVEKPVKRWSQIFSCMLGWLRCGTATNTGGFFPDIKCIKLNFKDVFTRHSRYNYYTLFFHKSVSWSLVVAFHKSSQFFQIGSCVLQPALFSLREGGMSLFRDPAPGSVHCADAASEGWPGRLPSFLAGPLAHVSCLGPELGSWGRWYESWGPSF